MLAVAWAVLFVRDVFPLLTYTESPADRNPQMWALFGVLTFTGVLLPLLTPRPYIPFDPAVCLFFSLCELYPAEFLN